MINDWKHIDRYYSELLMDIYPQPADPGTTDMAKDVIQNVLSKIANLKTVLDVGCGEGFCQPFFEELGYSYTGIALGKDVVEAKKQGRNVSSMDFNFLNFPDESFDLVFSRHSLEHSPFPILTLMEWHRVARVALCVVLPRPTHFGWDKPNHYGVMARVMAVTQMKRAGWEVIWSGETTQEYRWLAQKVQREYDLKEILNEEEP